MQLESFTKYTCNCFNRKVTHWNYPKTRLLLWGDGEKTCSHWESSPGYLAWATSTLTAKLQSLSNHQPSQFSIYSTRCIEWVLKHLRSTTCALYREDCEGWWLPNCCIAQAKGCRFNSWRLLTFTFISSPHYRKHVLISRWSKMF